MKTESISHFQRRVARAIAGLKGNSKPILLMKHGRGVAYLLSVNTFRQMQERMKILEGIARGEQAIRRKRVLNHAQARQKLKQWITLPPAA